jgi:hypothetical protein
LLDGKGGLNEGAIIELGRRKNVENVEVVTWFVVFVSNLAWPGKRR